MKCFNNHVHYTMLANIGNDVYSPIVHSTKGFGLAPKFELVNGLAYVVAYEPKNGLRGLLSRIRCLRPECELYVRAGENLSELNPTRWVTLYRWLETWAYTLNLSIIRTKRTDRFKVGFNIDEGGCSRLFWYEVYIRAQVTDVRKFYLYLKHHAEEEMRNLLINLVKDEIERNIRRTGGNPSFPIVNLAEIGAKELEDTGYRIEQVRIQYVSRG